jgi:hypothetical protein
MLSCVGGWEQGLVFEMRFEHPWRGLQWFALLDIDLDVQTRPAEIS